MASIAPSQLQENLRSLVASNRHVTPILDREYSSGSYRKEISDLAKVCPQTALAFGMHLYQIWAMRIRHPDIISRYRERFVHGGHLMCSLNDSGTYFISPTDLCFEKFPLKALRVKGGYSVSGRKQYSSMSNFVDYTPLTAIERDANNDTRLVSLFVRKEGNSISVAADWNSMSMPDTATNSIIIDEAFVPDEDIMHSETVGHWPPRREVLDLDLFFYRFHICITYEAIGQSALNIIRSELSDSDSITSSFRSLPYPQYQLASMLINAAQNQALSRSLSSDIDQYIDGGLTFEEMDIRTLIAKESITATAETIVNVAMALVGTRSLSKSHPLSALYTNVKAGRFHPPQAGSAYELIAKSALGINPQRPPRWGAKQ
jgi:alkylation response protein AidB-like acyl-CoA dehydrogenase